ncbi:MAG TPA: glycosyltransferase family 2 protein, partial [Thermoleophilaceae bacterium]
MTTPVVSAVIPTVARPAHVVAAVRSALAQTLREIEVVVVVDGPDAATAAALGEVGDPRLRVVELPARGGPGGARNAGVAAARGEWVAFLDDDDLWAPRKLELQLAAARESGHAQPVVACREDVRGHGASTETWPRRLPDPGEDIGDYLLARRGLFWGEGSVHTSTWFTRRELLERVRFREDIGKHEDWEWLVRAAREAGAGVTFVPESLAVRNVEDDRPRASRTLDWRLGLDHVSACRRAGLITPAAHASFLLTVISDEAAEQRSLEALWRLPWEAARHGRPRLKDLAICVGNFAVPRGWRTALRRRAARP